MDEKALSELVAGLTVRFGRFPTEEEVTAFIFGDAEKRNEIYASKGLNNE